MKTSKEVLEELNQIDPAWDKADQVKIIILEQWEISIRMDEMQKTVERNTMIIDNIFNSIKK